MAFVKLDCGILNSSVWAESVLRDVFLTALLMADPYVTDTPLPQLHARTMEPTGWDVPPGWYGFVPAAGIGIIRRALVTNLEAGMDALERLGAPEPESRSQEFEGRRLVRVDGGYVALNFDKYRERDLSSADRQRRYRLRKAAEKQSHVTPVTVEPQSPVTNVTSRRIVTQAEAEAEAEAEVRTEKAAPQTAPSFQQEAVEKSKPNDESPSKALLRKLAYQVLDDNPTAEFADLKNALKDKCARVAPGHYDAMIVGDALEATLRIRQLNVTKRKVGG